MDWANGTTAALHPLLHAGIATFTTFDVRLNPDVDLSDMGAWWEPEHVHVYDCQATTMHVDRTAIHDGVLTITVREQLDVRGEYLIAIDEIGGRHQSANITAIADSVVRTEEFDRAMYYDGDDLGCRYAKDGTTFVLWAPTAVNVRVVFFTSSCHADNSELESFPMYYHRGVWRVSVEGDWNRTAYVYRLEFADGTQHDSADPYATAAVINGERSVVLDPEEISIGDFNRMPAFPADEQPVIAETHVRDFSKDASSGIAEQYRGTYLGLVQRGSVNAYGDPTCLDHVVEMGITHLQLQPIFDFSSVDERKPLDDENYNWGYDPFNYNVPEGSFSTDACDPACRITETKRMVRALHDAGVRVIMDVVYNHVHDAARHPFQLTVPGYYFRYTDKGTLTNDSRCGNDVASERLMVRKYIVHSVRFWATRYRMDGFRFDLMGLIDLETMRQIRDMLDEIDPSIIVLGEGWDMCTTLPPEDMATQDNAARLNTPRSTVSFFNDSMRDALKGSVFIPGECGYVNGQPGMEPLVLENMLGARNVHDYANAGQVIQYAEIHDNMTLYDKLAASVPEDDEETRLRRLMLANAAVMLAFGIPEMQVGQEFARTKGGDDNSFRSGDRVNALDWNRMSEQPYAEAVHHMRELIALRKSIPELRETDYARIEEMAHVLASEDDVVAYTVEDTRRIVVMALNAAARNARITLDREVTLEVPELGYACQTLEIRQ